MNSIISLTTAKAETKINWYKFCFLREGVIFKPIYERRPANAMAGFFIKNCNYTFIVYDFENKLFKKADVIRLQAGKQIEI